MNHYPLDNIQWLDFSGSPAILIPENLQEKWWGFYDTKPDPDMLNAPFDFAWNGQTYYVNAEFDFDNPITDYDRLCQKLELALTYTFGNEQILALDAFFDTFGWVKEQLWVCNGAISFIDEEAFDQLEWQPLCQWAVQSETVYLINSCLTLLNLQDLTENIDYQKIQLETGTYQIEFAEYTDEFITRIFRFTKV